MVTQSSQAVDLVARRSPGLGCAPGSLAADPGAQPPEVSGVGAQGTDLG